MLRTLTLLNAKEADRMNIDMVIYMTGAFAIAGSNHGSSAMGFTDESVQRRHSISKA